MDEVVVARFEDETEADTAAGYLRSIGLSARVSFNATAGAPRQVVPIRVVAPLGDYALLVGAAQADDARRELRARGGPSARPRRYRWLGAVLVLLWVLPLIVGAIGALGMAFGR